MTQKTILVILLVVTIGSILVTQPAIANPMIDALQVQIDVLVVRVTALEEKPEIELMRFHQRTGGTLATEVFIIGDPMLVGIDGQITKLQYKHEIITFVNPGTVIEIRIFINSQPSSVFCTFGETELGCSIEGNLLNVTSTEILTVRPNTLSGSMNVANLGAIVTIQS